MIALRALAAAALALVVATGAALAAPTACAPDRLDIRGDWGAAQFSVEIADTPESQARGLMFRESLPASHAMLFVYDQPGAPAFWMKNTLIPLDMLFVTPEGKVQHVHPMAVPGDLTPIRGGDGVLAVLEIRGGLAGAIGIGPGDEMRHPAFGAEAAWACADGDGIAAQ
ncbi:DUF192 domain-containing protein [Sinisalibacter lacisalsi]|uniref:DUF192 domain-containing protein n=1 Tax=Sinisalibacter lacisalsi TaxID=1526570 RepID=A0ABQ1QNI5_9RHOB|nr:DUF192 domain-containing protein [Sinisalibacter lacisalsi]GGD32561.1 hypothetical protein GCM10011358_15860 [Sinisalibacter lacisalsi]